jgi:hypothetical protein
MAYIYRRLRSPFWYVQFIDANGRKHDKSTGLRTDDPNDTLKAKALRVELEAKEFHRAPIANGATWDSWVSNFFSRHCQTERTLERYKDAWKWIALCGLKRKEGHTHWSFRSNHRGVGNNFLSRFKKRIFAFIACELCMSIVFAVQVFRAKQLCVWLTTLQSWFIGFISRKKLKT